MSVSWFGWDLACHMCPSYNPFRDFTMRNSNVPFSLVLTSTSHRCVRSLSPLRLSHPPQAMQYMELIPQTQRPVSGTPGALERRRQLLSQLPVYDQDPMKCQSLSSEDEVCLLTSELLSGTTDCRWQYCVIVKHISGLVCFTPYRFPPCCSL